jgi:hypothetical protein
LFLHLYDVELQRVVNILYKSGVSIEIFLELSYLHRTVSEETVHVKAKNQVVELRIVFTEHVAQISPVEAGELDLTIVEQENALAVRFVIVPFSSVLYVLGLLES